MKEEKTLHQITIQIESPSTYTKVYVEELLEWLHDAMVHEIESSPNDWFGEEGKAYLKLKLFSNKPKLAKSNRGRKKKVK